MVICYFIQRWDYYEIKKKTVLDFTLWFCVYLQEWNIVKKNGVLGMMRRPFPKLRLSKINDYYRKIERRRYS
mgnify:CR=1 FL=1